MLSSERNMMMMRRRCKLVQEVHSFFFIFSGHTRVLYSRLEVLYYTDEWVRIYIYTYFWVWVQVK